MYHNLLSFSNPQPKQELQLHCGLYSFDYLGGRVIGDLKSIGDENVVIHLMLGGKITMPVLKFIDSRYSKL